MFKNLIFDIDGTLLNTKEVGMRALQKALYDDFHIEQTLAELEFAFSGTALQVYEKYHIPLDRQDAFAQHVLENSEIMAPSIDPFPGIEDLLQQLQQQAINLAIVTSENHFELEAIFGKKTIAHYLSAIRAVILPARIKPKLPSVWRAGVPIRKIILTMLIISLTTLKRFYQFYKQL